MPLRFFKRDSSPRETCHLFLRSALRVPLLFIDLRKRFNRLSSDSFGFLMTVVTYLTPLFASLCSYDLVKIAKATRLLRKVAAHSVTQTTASALSTRLHTSYGGVIERKILARALRTQCYLGA